MPKKKLASASQRVFAWIVDMIVIVVIAAVLGGLGFGSLALGNILLNPGALAFGVGSVFLLIAVIVVYTLFLEGMWQGQTLGKKALNIRVVDRKSGKPETVLQSFIRNILRIIDNQLLGLVALILVVTTKDKQRIGDMLAKTIVIQE